MYYLVGIKGSGMSALAQILYDLNYIVRGCDIAKYCFTEEKLLEKDIIIDDLDDIELNNNYTYIIGNSFKNKKEHKIIKNNKFKLELYNDFIDSFFKNYYKICITGTHGKTTTTKLISNMIDNNDVISLIGDGTGYAKTNAKYFIFEGCEYKNTFLKYNPDLLIINNIDLDHIDYFKDINQVINSFQKLLNKTPKVILNNNCKNSKELKDYSNNYILRYNVKVKEKNNCYILYTEYENKKNKYKIPKIDYMINNFLSAIYTAYLLNIKQSKIKKVIKNFELPKRRLTSYKDQNNNIIIDDYAHHPKEIELTLNTIKKRFKDRKIITIFQPHTYSRFSYFYKDIIERLNISDEFYISNIFLSKREENIRKNIINDYPLNLDYIKTITNSIIIIMGAGDIFEYYKENVNPILKSLKIFS